MDSLGFVCVQPNPPPALSVLAVRGPRPCTVRNPHTQPFKTIYKMADVRQSILLALGFVFGVAFVFMMIAKGFGFAVFSYQDIAIMFTASTVFLGLRSGIDVFGTGAEERRDRTRERRRDRDSDRRRER